MEIFLPKWVTAHLYTSIVYILIPTSFICPPKQKYAIPDQGFICSDASTLKAFITFTRKATPSFSINMFWVRYKAQKDVGIQSFPQEEHLGPYFLCLYSCHIWNLPPPEVAAHGWHTFCNCFIENQRDLKLFSHRRTKKTPKHWSNQTQKVTQKFWKSFFTCHIAHLLTDTCSWTVSKLQHK